MLAVTHLIADSSKPREELDYKEIYPDLSETDQLNVYIQLPGTAAENETLLKQPLLVGDLKKPSFRKVTKRLPNYPKFLKTLTDYGFQDPGRPRTAQFTKTLTRPFSCDEDIKDVTRKKLKLVEYDMDEQDVIYLKQQNASAGIRAAGIKLTPEVFEILMTTLENEWNSLEQKISMKEGKYQSSIGGLIGGEMLQLDNGGDAHKYGNDDGIVEGSIMEQKCAICNDSDCENSNAIVFCDGCNIAVHQECYGVAFIPEGQWLCRKCMISKNRDVHCIFCPSTTGAFKQLDSSLWSHVVCALWITELYFANPVYMEPIEGIYLIPKTRWKLACYICKQRNVGACIQCHNKNCFQAYHVTCAKRSGLYMKLTKGVSGAISNKATLRTYCDKHAPQHTQLQHEVQSGIEKTRLYFRDLKILKEKNLKIQKKKETANKLNIFKWKTESDTPIAPQLFADILEAKLIELKVTEKVIGYDIDSGGQSSSGSVLNLVIAPNTSKEQKLKQIRIIATSMCRYWCLKREHKNGAPLIRKNNNMELSSIVYGSNNEEEIESKLIFGKILIKDLNEVLQLVQNVVDRQQMISERNEITQDTIDLVYFPIKQIIENILIKYGIRGGASGGIFDCLIDKVEKYEFHESLTNFISELKSLLENKKNASTKISKKILRELNLLKNLSCESEEIINKDYKSGEGSISLPFVNTSGIDISFKRQDVKKQLDLEGLSDVEALEEDQEIELFQAIGGVPPRNKKD